MLKVILKWFGDNKVLMALIEGLLARFLGELPSAVESALTIRDKDVERIASRIGIKQEAGVKALRDALRDVAKSVSDVIKVANEWRV